MTEHEDDEGYDNWKDSTPRRSQRTRFRELEDKEEKTAKRDKRSSKPFPSTEKRTKMMTGLTRTNRPAVCHFLQVKNGGGRPQRPLPGRDCAPLRRVGTGAASPFIHAD